MKVAGLLGLLLLATGPGQAATPTHCAANEQTVFSCVTDHKVVSVCASGDLAQHGGSLSYRFGALGRPEISYPSPGQSQEVVKAGRWVFAGGGGAWLAFHRSAYRYIVYSAVGRGWHEKAGLAVEKGGRLLANLRCRGMPVSELGPDFFSSAGISDDETPFDLP
jgi:hypothetical protein